MERINHIGIIFLLILALVVGGMVPSMVSAADKPIVIKLAHLYPPQNIYARAGERFAKNVAEHTNGRVKVELFGSGTMGTWRETIEGLQFGTTNCVIESVGTLDRYDPLPGIEAYPYLIRDTDHFNSFWYGPVGTQLHEDIAQKTNFRTIGAIYRGTRNLTCNRKIEKVEDLKGLKLRVPPLKMYKLTWQYLGASGVPMSFKEVFTSIQQGIIDGQENPLIIIHDFKMNEVCKYLVMTRHVTGAMTFIFYDPWFKKLPADIQKIITEDVEEASKWANELGIKGENDLKETMVKKGMILIEPDLEPFRAKTAGMIKDFPELKEYYEKIKAIK